MKIYTSKTILGTNRLRQQIGYYFCWLFILVNLFSCVQKEVQPPNLSLTKERIPKSNFFINSIGDSIPTNVPLIIKGRKTDPQTVKKPKIVPYKERPKITPFRSNKVIAGQPKRFKLPQDKSTVIFGKNGIPFPKKVRAHSTKVAALNPKPSPALLPQMKDHATIDIQYVLH